MSVMPRAVRPWLKIASRRTLIMRLALQAITDHFGSDFVRFISTDIAMAGDGDLAYPYSLDMPRVERSFVMDAIDDLRPKAERHGGRIAYMAFFGGTSWKAEKRMLFNKTAPCRAQNPKPEAEREGRRIP